MKHENTPKVWQKYLPEIKIFGNKYTYGHVIINGGDFLYGSTGAAKLAAMAALRCGSGLASIVCNKNNAKIYAANALSIMIKIAENIDKFEQIISDKRVTSVLIGPGNGLNQLTKDKVLCALALRKKTVLDADALTIFQDNPQELFNNIKSEVVLTPHQGEFSRIFEFSEESRLESVLAAAKLSSATIILKGRDSIIASPEGKYIINKDAPPNLAKAGTGDVLAGIIAGLIAQGVPSFYASCMACYVHSKAAENIGFGLIAEDLLDHISQVIDTVR
jgi:hydroxyethylthiazole kinase-like uncharacterized protein yjeF